MPESSFFVFQICSVPSWLTSDLPTGRSPLSFNHVIFGGEWPVAWQRTEILLFFSTKSCAGGVFVKRGSWNTLKRVQAESCPKMFDALHSYEPKSAIFACNMVSCPSFTTVLDCAKPPLNLDHLITAGGKLITWHFGRVMFFPTST